MHRCLRRTLTAAIAVACAMFVCLAPGLALAKDLAAAARDGTPARSGTDTILIKLHADASAEQVATRRITVMSDTAIRSTGRQRVFYRDTLDTLEVIEAFTEKADGRKVPVGPSRIFTRDDAAPSSDVDDRKAYDIIFPDLGVGDSIVVTTRKTSRPPTPGHYTKQFYAVEGVALQITLIAPRSLPLQVAAIGDGYSDRLVVDDATQIRTITRAAMELPVPVDEPGYIRSWDRTSHVQISAYGSYADYGHAQWAVAAPRIAATPEISALAEEITRGIGDRRAQAEAIDRWVKRNIRYIAIEIGAGGFVPEAAASVLADRYGDCKGQSALMMALLAEKGIDSEFVHLNTGNIHTFPQVPLAAFNHQILYLPEFNVYADTTRSTAAFGVMSEDVYDKPVVRFSANRTTVDRTPAMRPDEHSATNRTRMKVAADGTVTGETAETTTGAFALHSRRFAANLPTGGYGKSASARLRSNGTQGQAQYATATPAALAEPFVLAGNFTLNDKVTFKPSSQHTIPVGLTVRARPGSLLGRRYEKRTLPFFCWAGRQIEDIEVTFADGALLPQVPQGVRVDTEWFNYASDYKLDGRTLKISRVFTSTVTSQACPAKIEAEIAGPMKKVSEDLARKLKFGAASAPAATAESQKQAAALPSE